jgi:hypothetical protein
MIRKKDAVGGGNDSKGRGVSIVFHSPENGLDFRFAEHYILKRGHRLMQVCVPFSRTGDQIGG